MQGCCTQPADNMKTTIILLAAVAVVGVSAFRDSDESDSDEYPTPTTRMPCPDVCTAEYDPVCARDKRWNLYKFSNPCWMDICGCKMWLKQVPLERCPDRAPGCPLRGRQPAQRDSSESSDESQPAPSSGRRHHGNNDLRHESEENW